MKVLAVTVATLLATSSIAEGDVVTLSFYKDKCGAFLQSEPSDQEMYLLWATSKIKKELAAEQKPTGAGLVEAASVWIRDYCASHPLALFVDATEAAKAQLTSAKDVKP